MGWGLPDEKRNPDNLLLEGCQGLSEGLLALVSAFDVVVVVGSSRRCGNQSLID